MNILALECSQLPSSLCLYLAESETCVEHQWNTERNHDAELFPALKRCMERLGEAPLDLIIVGAGPGSYGGVRIALATAEGMAMVKSCPIVALDSWIQLSEGESRWLISDARRGGWTLRHPQGRIEVVNLEDIQELQQSGKALASLETEQHLSQKGLSIDLCGLCPTAAGLLASWHSLTEPQQRELLATPPAPIYVRQPHITQAKRKPWECG